MCDVCMCVHPLVSVANVQICTFATDTKGYECVCVVCVYVCLYVYVS